MVSGAVLAATKAATMAAAAGAARGLGRGQRSSKHGTRAALIVSGAVLAATKAPWQRHQGSAFAPAPLGHLPEGAKGAVRVGSLPQAVEAPAAASMASSWP